MKQIFFITPAFLFLLGCNSDVEIRDLRGDIKEEQLVSNTPVTSENNTNTQEPATIDQGIERLQDAQEAQIQETQESLTTVEFNKMVHDFGDVKPEVENKTTFRLKNTGTKPLIVENVQASCGCTTPKKPEKPILPGQSDEIQVSFKSNPGQTGVQNKSVTVTTNTAERVHVLEIRATVKG